MKIPGSQMLVNPVRTNETVSGAVNTPNVMGNFGIETKFAEIVEQNAYKYQELRDNEQILGSESCTLENAQDIQGHQLGLKTDPSYYEKEDKFIELTQRFKDRKEKYLKLARENGYKEEIINATVEKLDRDFEEIKAIHGKYSLDYLKEKNKKADYLMADERAKTMSQIYLNGSYEKGNMQYKENGIALWKMYQKENLTPEQFTSRVNRSKQDAIASRVMALVNTSEIEVTKKTEDGKEIKVKVTGEELLNEWRKKGPQEFQELFGDLQQKFGDYDVVLTADDFELFQSSINGAVNAIETKRKAKEEDTLYGDNKKIKEIKKNFFAVESKKYPSGISPNMVGDRLYTDAMNNYYNTQFKNYREGDLLGYRAKIIDDSNTQELFYNDQGISGIEIINKNLEEGQRYAGGYEEIGKRIILDGKSLDYKERGVRNAYGYNTARMLAKPDSETSNLIANIYSPNSRVLLAKTKGEKKEVKVDVSNSLNKYEKLIKTTKTARPVTAMSPAVPYGATAQMNAKEPEWEVLLGAEYQNSGYTGLTIFGKMEGLKYAAKQNDINAQATVSDMQNIAQDVLVLSVLEETGGILPEDVADDLGMKSNAGMIITELGITEQSKIYNYYLQENKDVQKNLFETLTPAFNEIMGDTEIGDLGNGRFVRLEGVKDVGKETKGINDFLRNNDFTAIIGQNPDGTPITKIVKGDELIPVARAGSNKLLITYNGNPVLLNGGVAVYEVGGIE